MDDSSAKRYERLMKAHGVTPNGAAGSPSKTPVKKEKPENEGKSTKARTSKKRKLEQVDEDAGDIDEPSIKGEVKSEMKSEVKREDAMMVKREPGSSGVASIRPPADVFSTPAGASTRGGQGSDGDDDDDDVLVVSATDNRSDSVHVHGAARHGSHLPALAHAHHLHHHAMPHFHHPLNHAADLSFHHQLLPRANPTLAPLASPTSMRTSTRMRTTSNPAPRDILPYGFPASRSFTHNPDTSGFH